MESQSSRRHRHHPSVSPRLLLLLLLSLMGLFTSRAQVLATSGHNVTEKAGTCPDTKTVTGSGNCTEECQSDASCRGSLKCCPAGCGTSCQTPDDKPGSCPTSSLGISGLGLCVNTCKSDSECPGSQKCCENGCGMKACSSPV